MVQQIHEKTSSQKFVSGEKHPMFEPFELSFLELKDAAKYLSALAWWKQGKLFGSTVQPDDRVANDPSQKKNITNFSP